MFNLRVLIAQFYICVFPEQYKGISLYIREHFPSKLKETAMTIVSFFVELDLTKRKWIIGCFYNPKISFFIVISFLIFVFCGTSTNNNFEKLILKELDLVSYKIP